MKKTILILVLTLVLTACGSHKKTFERKEVTNIVQTETKGVHAIKTTETTRYGDTLQGSIPLPELTEKPVVIEVESGGTKLKLITQKGKISYEVIPKAIETTKTTEETNEDAKSTITVASTLQENSVDDKKQWRPPWWLFLITFLAGASLGIYFSQPVKTFLRPILKHINR